MFNTTVNARTLLLWDGGYVRFSKKLYAIHTYEYNNSTSIISTNDSGMYHHFNSSMMNKIQKLSGRQGGQKKVNGIPI